MNNKYQKIILALAIAGFSAASQAGYMAYYPLEVKKGGSLPDGSINIGTPTNPTDPTGPTEPNGNCEYDGMSKLAMFKVANGPFAAGDVLLLYRGKLIGAQSPSNGLSVPAGITSGQIKLDTPEVAEAEICGDNLSSYPTIPIPTGTPPVDDNASTITFTETITSNDCPDARANFGGACYVESSNVSQNLSLQLDDTNGITIYTNSFSSADKANIDSATTISTSTGKSCSIDRRDSSSVGCYNKTLILESDFGSTITFTIK